MSGGHFGSTFQTYDLQPQAKCKNQMYVSVKRMSKVRETLHQPSITFSPSVAGASLSCPPVLVGQANISKTVPFRHQTNVPGRNPAISEGRPGTVCHFRRMPGSPKGIRSGPVAPVPPDERCSDWEADMLLVRFRVHRVICVRAGVS